MRCPRPQRLAHALGAGAARRGGVHRGQLAHGGPEHLAAVALPAAALAVARRAQHHGRQGPPREVPPGPAGTPPRVPGRGVGLGRRGGGRRRRHGVPRGRAAGPARVALCRLGRARQALRHGYSHRASSCHEAHGAGRDCAQRARSAGDARGYLQRLPARLLGPHQHPLRLPAPEAVALRPALRRGRDPEEARLRGVSHAAHGDSAAPEGRNEEGPHGLGARHLPHMELRAAGRTPRRHV
mmetsp:Transcript_72513/g.224137  ORF Transcript_72513/g.224137 Transcript_72513/m.224137 type:complete len:240 (+) Transcript_72513:113-832(+)